MRGKFPIVILVFLVVFVYLISIIGSASVSEGSIATLTVEGINCSGTVVNFAYFEYDVGGINTSIPPGSYNLPNDTTFLDGTANATWLAVWFNDTDDTDGNNDPDIFFNASCPYSYWISDILEVKQAPNMTSIQCEVDSVWDLGSFECGIAYGSNLTSVRATCSGSNPIQNATFRFENIEDNNIFFDQSTTCVAGTCTLDVNPDLTILDSGEFVLTATCVDTDSAQASDNVTANVGWGSLNAQLVSPQTPTDVNQNQFFPFTSQVTCSVGECGNVSAILDPWWNASWNYRQGITITSASALTNYPAYISVANDPDMNADYSDLRFIDGDCDAGSSLLDYEIESYDGSSAHVWVRIPSLLAGTTNICMYYGNSDASSAENPTGVWDSNYIGVWHMTEVNAQDSTNNNNDGTASGNVAFTSSGRIGGANSFDGDNDYINMGDVQTITETITAEAWVNLASNATSSNQRIINRDDGGSGGAYLLHLNEVSSSWYGFIFDVDTGNWAYSGSSSTYPNTNQWYYIVGVYDGSSVIIYINGVAESSSVNTGSIDACCNLWIGGKEGSLSEWINGILDEIRISNTPRTQDWINQSYQMVENQGSYVSFGIEESSGMKGAISETIGAIPFYTTDSNPRTGGCLDGMKSGDTCQTTWSVNATGDLDTYEFFVDYDAVQYLSVGSDQTPKVNITITTGVGCVNDTDCSPPTPYCDAGTCVECLNNSHCDDGAYCNGTEICSSGVCQSGAPIDCSDGIACTLDSCNEATDSCDNVESDALCDDTLWCNGFETCSNVTGCVAGTPPNCDDGINCTNDGCNEVLNQCANIEDDLNCDDGAYCNGAEYCDAALDCQSGTPITCSDMWACSVDFCNEAIDSCDANFSACECPGGDSECDDNLWCNGQETCNFSTLMCESGTPPDCSDAFACTIDSCNETSDTCDHITNDSACDDNLWCDGAEICSDLLGCQEGTPPDCSDTTACTLDSCNEATDSCDNIENDTYCDNDLFCDGVETCDAFLGCQGGTPPDTSDGVDCTIDDCNETDDTIIHTPNDAYCDNGAYCDGSEYCDAILDCQSGTPITCDDGVLCTSDTCNETIDDCVFDTSGCDCSAQGPAPTECNDTNPCTDDVCNASLMCENINNDANPCDDGFWCTENDRCSAGSCISDSRDCSDSVSCTVDSCNEGTDSCDRIPNNLLCQDGAWCNGTETCDALLDCQPGIPQDCDDSNSSTLDYCNETLDMCINEYISQPCILTNAYWSETNVLNGTLVDLIVNATGDCGSEEVNFTVLEYDFPGGAGFDDPVAQNPFNVFFVGDSAIGSWLSEYQDEGLLETYPPEYYFIATLVNNASETITSSDPKLEVNSTNPVCGDGIKNGIEECDGADLGGEDCISQGYGGGTLLCNSSTCMFDYSSCIPIDNPPNINLISPANNTETDQTTITFTGFVSDDNSISNVTLFINSAFDQINTSGANNANYIFTKTLSDGTYTWYYFACDGASQCVSSEIRTLIINTTVLPTCDDTDGDGYGVCPNCGVASGCTYEGDDCDDTNINVNPGETEICNAIDDNCVNGIDEDDGDCADPTPRCDEFGNCVQCIDHTDCDNGDYCDGVESCVGDTCQAGAPIDCSDAFFCTLDSCNEATDSCDHTANDSICDNGDYCDGLEICSLLSGCQPGTPPDTSDGVDCTIDDCNETDDTITHTPDNSLCLDGLWCNGDEYCDAILDCQNGASPNCDDGVSCTSDSCYEGLNLLDNIGICINDASGCPCTLDADCDDSNTCTDDVCNASLMCENLNNDANPCDDGFWCTENDRCSAGICSGTQRSVDDGVFCTVDSCDEANNQTLNIPDDSRCDDTLVCTGVETCHATLDCQAGTDVDCSGNDLSEIATCSNDPDNIDFTWDYFPAFTSQCLEPSGTCTTNTQTLTHTCDVAQCSAQCEDHPDCDDANPLTTDICLSDCTCLNSAENCSITALYWNVTSIDEDEIAFLIINGTNCSGVQVDFTVLEYDGFIPDLPWVGDDYVNLNPVSVFFNAEGTQAIGTWQAEWQDDGLFGLGGNPEYYFMINTSYSNNVSSTAGADLLNVSLVYRKWNITTIQLKQGKNSFSLPSLPKNLSVTEVFSGIAANANRIYTYEGGFKIYHFDGKPSNLYELEVGKGYVLFMDNDDTLVINGTRRNESLQRPMVHLTPGWNLIGTFSNAYEAATILKDVNYDGLYNYDNVTGRFELVSNTSKLQGEKGYWIYVEEEADFVPLTGIVIENEE